MSATLCRTCLRPITHETRTEPGYLPREGWYDDCRTDALVCFKAIDYRHVPLEGRERAYYDAGYRAAEATLRESIASGVEGAWRGHRDAGNREAAAALYPLPGLIREGGAA